MEVGRDILGILFGAALLGIIIMVMDRGKFPSWWRLIVCVFAATVPPHIIALLVPGPLEFIYVAATLWTALMIFAIFGMKFPRACIAAAIYYTIGITLFMIFLATLHK